MALDGDASFALCPMLQDRDSEAKNRPNPIGGAKNGLGLPTSILLGIRRRGQGMFRIFVCLPQLGQVTQLSSTDHAQTQMKP